MRLPFRHTGIVVVVIRELRPHKGKAKNATFYTSLAAILTSLTLRGRYR